MYQVTHGQCMVFSEATPLLAIAREDINLGRGWEVAPPVLQWRGIHQQITHVTD